MDDDDILILVAQLIIMEKNRFNEYIDMLKNSDKNFLSFQIHHI